MLCLTDSPTYRGVISSRVYDLLSVGYLLRAIRHEIDLKTVLNWMDLLTCILPGEGTAQAPLVRAVPCQ